MGLTMMGLLTFTSCSSSDDSSKKEETTEVTIKDAEYDAIVNQYVDNVVIPTYSDLKAKNSALYQAVVAFGDAPSNANFQAICNAWLAARGWQPVNHGSRARHSSLVLLPTMVLTPTWTPGRLTKRLS